MSAFRWAIAVALVCAAGCKKDREQATPPERWAEHAERGAGAESDPARVAAQESERGRKACQSYVDQVCDCALKVPDLGSECEMARSRPQALAMNQRAAMADGNATERDRLAIRANADQIARACIEDAAALMKRGCAPPKSATATAADQATEAGAAASGSAKPAPTIGSGSPDRAKPARTEKPARPTKAETPPPSRKGSGPVPAPPPEPEPLQDLTR